MIEIHTARIYLFIAPRHILRKNSNAIIARFALSHEVCVLDGGNCFDAYGIARLLRFHTAELNKVMSRIYVARAFTCYQMVSLLKENEQTTRAPTVILDFLATFYDESVSRTERLYLFDTCLSDLQHLSPKAPLIITAHLEGSNSCDHLLAKLEEVAHSVSRFESPISLYQPCLF